MNENKAAQAASIYGMVQLVLIILRAFKVIRWNWFIVLLPFIVPQIIVIVAIGCIALKDRKSKDDSEGEKGKKDVRCGE